MENINEKISLCVLRVLCVSVVDIHINRRSPQSHKEHKGRTEKTDLTDLEVGLMVSTL